MAGALMPSGGGNRGRGRRGNYRPVADINVTPLVDVMLVLLIVFMVTAPLLTVAVPVDLPKTEAQSSIKQDDEPLIISINEAGEIYLQETKTSAQNLVKKLQAITKTNADARVFIRGDRKISYGKIMEIMGTLNAAGYRKVALVTELPTSDKKE